MLWLNRCMGCCAIIPLVLMTAGRAMAHGFVGDRFFPATVTTDDPLVADELALPTLSLSYIPGGGGNPETRVIDSAFEFDKLIVPKLAIGVSGDYLLMKPRGGTTSYGLDDLTMSVKYELWRNELHQAILSIGLLTTIGGSGSRRIGRDSFSTFMPNLYWGKGMGDLPDTLAYLKPVALTGTLGVSLPTEASTPNTLEWGVAVEYSLPYLQQHVEDVGLPEPFKNMIPLVEFAMSSPLNRNPGVTTGTINPGVLWESRYFQVGVEALLPVNGASGDHVGAVVQFQIYIDDLFPEIFGHPIFGE